MTLSALQWGRKVAPFLISLCCVLPWILIRPESATNIKVLTTLFLTAVSAGFLYVIMKIREPLWKREMDTYVGAQIRRDLMTLIPEDLNVTPVEREQLAKSELFKKLTGVFWETVDGNDALRAHKVHFYSNGFEYSTAIDAAVLCSFFACWYAIVSFTLGTTSFIFVAMLWASVTLICKWIAIPRARQHHLTLSAEQLDLLRREAGEFVADRFRSIVESWRAGGHATTPMSTKTPDKIPASKIAFAGFCLVVAGGLTSRGYLGPGPNVKSPTEVKSPYVSAGPRTKSLAVVFVHGVVGTREDTWLSPGTGNSFPELLAKDADLRDRVDVFAFEYFTPKLGSAPSIVDLSNQLRGDLDDNRVFDDHQKVVFLAHSMGGIIVRHFLINGQDRIAKVPMVFFYATPTNGSELAAIARLASVNPQFAGLTPLEGNDLLQSIQSIWLGSEKLKSIASYCAVETLSTYGVMIVTRSSATSLCNRPLDPLSANHIDIVKPADRSDPRYTRFVTALRREALQLDSSFAP